jgi:DNA-directed RNA polymerase subunit RPC12/RpoP
MVARMTPRPHQPAHARHCARCGAAGESPEDGMPEGWSLDVGDRGVTYLCATCTRDNVRSIEAKLDQEWW